MPNLTLGGLAGLLILLPGFLTAELVYVLSARPGRTEFGKVVQAFLYSFLVYVCFAAIRGQFPVSVSVAAAGTSQHYTLEFHFWPLIELTIIAGLLALAVAASMNHDFPLSALRWLKITQRTSRFGVWNDCFHTFGGYVQVELTDGRQVMGWLRFFSDTPDEAALFLEDAAWIGENGAQYPVDGAGMLLTRESGIRTIMFVKAVDNQAPTK